MNKFLFFSLAFRVKYCVDDEHFALSDQTNIRGELLMKLPKDPSKFSFGATSSTVTSLGIIFGLLTSGNPKASVIGSLLVIAVADNIADSLGIHIYRESTATKKRKHENVHYKQLHNPICHYTHLCYFVRVLTNRLRSRFLRGHWIWNTGFPELPHRRSTENQHTKRDSHPSRDSCSSNSHQSFSRPTNLHHIWLD